MENRTQSQQPGDSWRPQWPKRSWMLALRNRLAAMYGHRFQTLNDEGSILLWTEIWAQGLAGITGEQMRHGLGSAQRNYPDFPPTLPQFRKCCEDLPRPNPPRLDPPSIDRERALAAIARIKALIGKPRQPGKWWAEKIVAQHARGVDGNDYALRLAREALATES